MNAAPPHRPTATEISAQLATGPFATAAARGAVLVVAAGDPARLVFATPSALATFGARDLEALDATLFGAESPGARRLRQLARALPLGASPRLESLRFFAGRKAIPVGWLCARVVGADGADLLVASAPFRPGEETPAAAPVNEIPLVEPPPPQPEAPTALEPEAAPTTPPFVAMPIDGPVRFLWSCDDQGQFGAPDAALLARLGPNAPRQGETTESLRARAGFDPEDRWGAAIAARRTFSGLRVEWPEPGHARARVATLSGAPIIDRARGFAGFRGFGVFTGESIALKAGEAVEQIAPAASSAPPVEVQTSALSEMESGSAKVGASDVFAEPTPTPEPATSSEQPRVEAYVPVDVSPIPPAVSTKEEEVPPFDLLATASNPMAEEEIAPDELETPAARSASEAVDAPTEAASPEPVLSAADNVIAPLLPEMQSGAIEDDAPDRGPADSNATISRVLEETCESTESPIATEPDGVAAAAPESERLLDETRTTTPSESHPSVPTAAGESADLAEKESHLVKLESDTGYLAADAAPTAPVSESAADAAGAEFHGPGPTSTETEVSPVAFESLEAEISAVFAEQTSVAELADAHVSPPTSSVGEPIEDTPSDKDPPAKSRAPEAPDAPATLVGPDPNAARPGREGGGEIYRFPTPQPASVMAPNVVPIRPGAISALTPPGADHDSAADGGENVELSSQERDAFREIARALGVRSRDSRPDQVAGEAMPPANEDTPPPLETPAAPELAETDAAALLDVLPIGALVTRSGEALYLNRTLLDLIGYPSLASFRAENGLERIFRGRDPAALVGDGGDLPMVAAGGELMSVDAQARAISWRGEPAIMIALRRSRVMEHQAALRAVERDARAQAAVARDLAAALDVAADGMIRLDDTGRILGMNRRAEALLGYDQKEAAGESFLVMLTPGSQAEATAALDRVTREPVSASRGPGPELFARERGGRAIPVRIDFGRLSGVGTPEYFALLHDLSRLKGVEREREAAREAAVKASERKTDFLARVSHEIRTPLHAILGFAEVMIEERFGPIGNDRYKDYIKDIHASGRHVMSLANDLLDLAKIESGKMELQFAPVDINKIIRECVALMQPQAARERIIMRLSLLDRLPNVMADERSLRQIMLNLMSNAVKYNEPGGQVIVSTALDEAGHAVIRVRDTGVGMNDSELGVALEPFRRVPGGAARDGAGLGLPLTKALAEANHADFSIKSRKEHGTLVEVAFPRERAAQ